MVPNHLAASNAQMGQTGAKHDSGSGFGGPSGLGTFR